MKQITTTLLACLLLASWQPVTGQNTYPPMRSHIEFLGETPPLGPDSRLSHATGQTLHEKGRRQYPADVPNFTRNRMMPTPFAATALPAGTDPVRQAAVLRTSHLNPEPELSIDGMGQIAGNGSSVSDANGDISPQYYVQGINSTSGAIFQVFDHKGEVLSEPIEMNTLWQPFGGIGIGDPIILWDQHAGRWLLSEVGLFSDNVLYIAISTSSDPLGSYYVYRVFGQDLPDYPKYSIGTNAYYITTNELSSGTIPVYALDRQAMLEGQPDPEAARFGIPKFGAFDIFQIAAPVDIDGHLLPPAGSPQYVVRMYDDAWEGGEDKIELWGIFLDWADAENAFISGPLDIPTAPFDAHLCDGSIFECIDQPSPPKLSALQQVIMHRPSYRRFENYESILLNFSVDVTGSNLAGIRWMELRRSGEEPWAIYQEGTFAPDDGNNRFMGSIAQDAEGNMLLTYSITGPDKAPSMRYTGRMATDPPGVLTFPEYELAPGLSANEVSRWGDYAAISVEPQSGRDFWFTGQYMKSTGWGTRIGKVRLVRDSNDVGIQALVRPQNSGYLTDSETVEVELRNYGIKAQHDIGISYVFQGEAAVNEMISDTIPPDGTYRHTFSTPIDMDSIGNYHFIFYTTLPKDSFSLNDTLLATVAKLPRNDVALTAFTGLDFNVCDTSTTVGFTLSNTGVDTLYSALVSYQLNDAAAQPVSYSAALPPGRTDTLFQDIGPIPAGLNTLTATAGMPNGIPDERPSNDSISLEFNRLEEASKVTVRLLTDSYPGETQWQILDSEDNILFRAGPFEEEQTLYQQPVCLPDDCYILQLLDSFGDGLVGPPAGAFSILDEQGNELFELTDIDFGREAIIGFCTDTSRCSLLVNATGFPPSSAGNTDGRIVFNTTGGTGPYRYSIDGGENFQDRFFFLGLPLGTYECQVSDNFQCRYDTTIVLDVESSLGAVAPPFSLQLFPNPTEGFVRIVAEGLPGGGLLPVEVLSPMGQTVRRHQLSTYGNRTEGNLSLYGLPDGIYFLRFRHEALPGTYRIIKQSRN